MTEGTRDESYGIENEQPLRSSKDLGFKSYEVADCWIEQEDCSAIGINLPQNQIPKYFNGLKPNKPKAISDPTNMTPKLTIRKRPNFLGANLGTNGFPNTPQVWNSEYFNREKGLPEEKTEVQENKSSKLSKNIQVTNHLLHLEGSSPKPQIGGSLQIYAKSEEGSSTNVTASNFVDSLMRSKLDHPIQVDRDQFLKALQLDTKSKHSILKTGTGATKEAFKIPDDDIGAKKVRFCSNMIVIEFKQKKGKQKTQG